MGIQHIKHVDELSKKVKVHVEKFIAVNSEVRKQSIMQFWDPRKLKAKSYKEVVISSLHRPLSRRVRLYGMIGSACII